MKQLKFAYAGAVLATALFVAMSVWTACSDGSSKVPLSPNAVSTNSLADTQEFSPRAKEDTVASERVGASVDAVLAYEFSALMDSHTDDNWRETVEKLLYIDFQQEGMTYDEQEALRQFYRTALDRDLAASGAPSEGEGQTLSLIREELRRTALDISSPPGNAVVFDEKEDKARTRSGGDGDDCDGFQACAWRARNECQRYANAEAAVISAAAVYGCAFVGVISGTVTANPLIGVGSGVTCRLLTGGYLNYIKRLLEEECTVSKCGYFPRCI